MTATSVGRIGNSHLAAIELALSDAPGRWPGLRCACDRFRGRTVLETGIVGGLMRPDHGHPNRQFGALVPAQVARQLSKGTA